MAQRKKTATVQLKVRMKEALRARIEKAAKASRVSMNSEILERLEQSFQIENRFGGSHLIEVIETIATVMRSTGRHAEFYETGKLTSEGKWLTMPYPYDQSVKAAASILEHYRPPEKIVVPAAPPVELIEQVDPKKSAARLSQIYAQLGRIVADIEMDRKEPKK